MNTFKWHDVWRETPKTNERRELKIGDLVRHFKREFVENPEGEYLYQVIDFAKHTETGETLVIYKALYKPYDVFARPYDNFISKVDKEKYPTAQQEYRFDILGNAEV